MQQELPQAQFAFYQQPEAPQENHVSDQVTKAAVNKVAGHPLSRLQPRTYCCVEAMSIPTPVDANAMTFATIKATVTNG